MDLLLHFRNDNSFVNPSFPGDLNNALSTRSPSQTLAFSLVNSGVVILSRNSYHFVQLDLKSFCKKVEGHFVFYFDP